MRPKEKEVVPRRHHVLILPTSSRKRPRREQKSVVGLGDRSWGSDCQLTFLRDCDRNANQGEGPTHGHQGEEGR